MATAIAAVHSPSSFDALMPSTRLGITPVSERVATAIAAEWAEHACNVARAIGDPQGTIRIGTDNKANLQVASRTGTSRRSKHLLRRYYVLMQRIADGEVRLVHVPDEENPSDFLTKWVSAAKLRASLRYATGAAAQ